MKSPKRVENNEQTDAKNIDRLSNPGFVNSDYKSHDFVRQVDPNAVQNVMEIALQRYEKDLSEKRHRKQDELDYIDRIVQKEKEKEATEKEAVRKMKQFQAKELDI